MKREQVEKSHFSIKLSINVIIKTQIACRLSLNDLFQLYLAVEHFLEMITYLHCNKWYALNS